MRFRRVGTRLDYQNRWIEVFTDTLEDTEGRRREQTRIVEVGGRTGVVVLALHDGQIGLVRHERPVIGSVEWEAVRGFGESMPAEDARRELMEETGLAVSSLVDLGPLHPDSGLLANGVRLFVAHIDPEAPTAEPDGEVLELRWFTPGEVGELIDSQELTEASTLALLLRAERRGLVSLH